MIQSIFPSQGRRLMKKVRVKKEMLPLIDLAGIDYPEISSSPPGFSSQQLPPSTPCPHQHQTQLHQSLRDIIREERPVGKEGLAGQGNTATAVNTLRAVFYSTPSPPPPQSTPPS
ncbi:hypothetical protein FPOAC2_14217 [Fusarium poae]